MKIDHIEIEPVGEKKWVVVYFTDGRTWIPKLTECGKILSGIGKCEDLKYPGGRGWRYTRDFIVECFGKTRQEIDELYINKYDPNRTTKEAKALYAELDRIANKAWCA